MTKVINIKSGEKYDVYIGRAGHNFDGFYGNPHTIGGVYCNHCKGYHDREGAIEAFKRDFLIRIKEDESFRIRVKLLKDKVLGCFCWPQKCHGDVYIEYLDNLKE